MEQGELDNHEQETKQEYVTDRLREIYEKKSQLLKRQCADPVLPATQRDLQEMVKKGYINISSPNKRLLGTSPITAVFEFPPNWEVDQRLTGNYEWRLEKLISVYEHTKDEAILNPGQYLPRLIRNFESYVV